MELLLKFFLHISKRAERTFIEAFRRKNTIGSSQWEFERKNDGMITCSITKKQLTILLQTTPLVCNSTDDKKCAVILWVKSFGKKCRNIKDDT
jgi:hypothetical protein